jgi:hypothetical protein
VNDVEAAWLAGILEGEGCFHLQKTYQMYRGKRYGPYFHPVIKVAMTDFDIIERLQAITGVGLVRTVPVRQEWHKEQWIWVVGRKAHVALVIKAVYPHLGIRRREKADALLAAVQKGGE